MMPDERMQLTKPADLSADQRRKLEEIREEARRLYQRWLRA